MNATKHSKQFIKIINIRLTGVNVEPIVVLIVKPINIMHVIESIAA